MVDADPRATSPAPSEAAASLTARGGGRLQIGTVAALKSEKTAAFGWNLHAAHGEAGFAGSGRDSSMITR